MTGFPNVYAAVVFDLNPKVRTYIDQLNQSGQIDLDQNGQPYIIGCERQGSNLMTKFSRNNKVEHFLMNPRRKAEPFCSWDKQDGFVRPQQKQVIMVQAPAEDQVKRERQRRIVPMETIESIVDTIWED